MSKLGILSQVFQELPLNKLSDLTHQYQTDKHCKGFDTRTHLASMLFCHLAGADSIRDISSGLSKARSHLNHLGISNHLSKSSIAYQNKNRSHLVFRDFFYGVCEHLNTKQRPVRRKLKKLTRKVFLLDATVLPLCLSLFDWATFRRQKGGVKVHTVLDYDGCLPTFIHVTEASKHEVNIARTLRFPKGSVLVADRGYLDYTFLNDLDSSKVNFVIRAKDNMAYTIKETYISSSNPIGNILEDVEISLDTPASSKKYPKYLRLVRFWDSTKNQSYAYLTNNRNWKAQTVADIYKERWSIEVFFKHLKQLTRIKSFIGTTENAVLIQIWTAMISIVLLKYLQAKAKVKWHLSNLAVSLRIHLFAVENLWKWLNNEPKDPVLKKLPLFQDLDY